MKRFRYKGVLYQAYERGYEQEQQAKQVFVDQLTQNLAALLPTIRALGRKAPDSGAFQNLALENTRITGWLDNLDLTDVLTGTVLNRLADYAAGKKTAKQLQTAVLRLLEPAFVERAREQAQQSMHEVGITPDIIKRVLPASFAFEVAPDHTILREFSVFGNKLNTVERKTRAMAELLQKWNVLAQQLNEDLDSSDPITKLNALVTSIVVSTGIRPGMMGEGKLKTPAGELIRDPDGNPVKIETVGATGLKPEHVQFVRDGYARLEFPGKSGTINIAKLDDPTLIKVLRKQIESVQANSPESGLIFVTEDGRKVTPKQLNQYIQSIVGQGITATDFRKLRATQTFYQALKQRRQKLADQLLAIKEDAIDSMRDGITGVILDHLEEAAAEAQRALSHEDIATTIGHYISPRVVLHYLTNAGIDSALEQVVGDGRNLKIEFDPIDFYNKVLELDQGLKFDQGLKAAMLVMAGTLFQIGESFTDLPVDQTIQELVLEQARR